MKSSSFFENKPFTPHAPEQEKNAQFLAKTLKGLHMEANGAISAHGLTGIEPFPGDMDVSSIETLDKMHEQPANDITAAPEFDISAPVETADHVDPLQQSAQEQHETLADHGTEMPSTSPEELKAAIAQYYFELPALDVVRKKLLAKEGVDLEQVELNIMAACTKMQEGLYENFYQKMLADAQNNYGMDTAQAEQYFTLRMQNYTHDNPIFLNDHGTQQELIAENFFAQSARDAIEAIILTQKEMLSQPRGYNDEELPPELNMDTTLFDAMPTPTDTTSSAHITSEQIDAMRQRELGSIHFD